MAKYVAIPLEWPSTLEDVPTYYANTVLVTHTGPEFFLVFAEVNAPLFGLEEAESIKARPLLKIAVTREAMPAIARAIQDNVDKYLSRLEEEEEGEAQ